jgi:flagellar biosynthesis protein FlhG
MLHASDQAAGLRRLFRQTPCPVMALFVAGRNPRQIAMETLHVLTDGARRVVALDEQSGSISGLLTAFGYPEGTDLLAVLQSGHSAADAALDVAEGLSVVPVAGTARAVRWLDSDLHGQLENGITEFQRRADLLLINSASASDGLSPFVRAASRRLLVVEASGAGARAACQWVKCLASAGAGSLEVAVSHARDRADATALFASLEDYTTRHVGLPLVWRGEVERDPLADAMTAPLGARHPADEANAFLRRLRAWTTQAGVAG